MHCLGLMSGTSADGVDAVLVRFDGPPQHPQWCMLRHHHQPYPLELQQRVVAAGQGAPMPASCWLELAEAITEVQAKAVKACDPDATAELIGCHGQTVWHRPPARGTSGAPCPPSARSAARKSWITGLRSRWASSGACSICQLAPRIPWVGGRCQTVWPWQPTRSAFPSGSQACTAWA